MAAPLPSTGSEVPSAAPRPSPKGIRRFVAGPQIVDRSGTRFILVIFLLVIVVFAVAFYAFEVSVRQPSQAPVQFDVAYILRGNGTFNVTSDSNMTWAWNGFLVNLTINSFGTTAVPLAPSGQNATLLVGSATHKDPYHVVWLDRDRNGAVSPGDVFRITGNGVGLPPLSYIQFGLTWRAGNWTATEYFVTSSTIV